MLTWVERNGAILGQEKLEIWVWVPIRAKSHEAFHRILFQQKDKED